MMDQNLKDRLLQDAKLVLFGFLTLGLILLTVLELIPNESLGVRVGETFNAASSSLSPFDAQVKDYQTQISGTLENPGDEAVKIDAIGITISDGKNTRTLELEGFELSARSTYEFSYAFEGQIAYDRVTEVALTTGGVKDVLPNQIETESPVSSVAVFYLALMIPAVWLLVRAAKGRYYLYQESSRA